MRLLSLAVVSCAVRLLAASDPVIIPVYHSPEGGFNIIRSPQLLVTKKGTYLAFAQGRKSAFDQAENKILLKRSLDGGKTWSPLQVVAESGQDALNSICVIQVRETGRILMIGSIMPFGYERFEFRYLNKEMQDYNREQGREKMPNVRAGYEGPGIARGYLLSSDDDGNTWSPMVDITKSIKLPPPSLWVMPGPGIAIQLEHGKHAGRIVVPCYSLWLDLASKTPEYTFTPYSAYSDDGGKTWQTGKLADQTAPGANRKTGETQMVELLDGSIMLNGRSAKRNVAISRDGGETWSAVQEDPQLEVSGTAAGFIRYSGGAKGENSRLLFTNPVFKGRTEGRVWMSYDDGQTWPVYKVLAPGRFSYSGLAKLPDGQIGCLFDAEKNTVKFARFGLDWLTDGKDK